MTMIAPILVSMNSIESDPSYSGMIRVHMVDIVIDVY
jgi:hypothetical protein